MAKPNMLLLRISDEPSFDFVQLAHALEAIDCSDWDVKSITLCLDDFEYMDATPSAELCMFFKAIGSISSLIHLKIYDSGREGILPISVVAPLLHLLGNRLEQLELSGITLCGSSNELNDFSCSLQGLIQLKSFRFTKFSDIVCTDQLSRDGVEALFNTVAQLPNIQAVNGDIHWFLEGAQRKAFTGILSCSHKLSLTLEIEPGMDGETFAALVVENGTIEMSMFQESVHGTYPLQYLMLLALAVELNSASGIHKIVLDMEGMEQHSHFDEFFVYLAQFFAQVPTSKDDDKAPLEVEVYMPPTYQFKNTAITAFAELLQNNFGMQIQFLRENRSTGTHDKDAAMHSQIDTFLCLNQNQRGYLMENLHEISPEQWVESFAAVNNDPRCVHYYLSKMPWMCEENRQPVSGR
ncbi:expressed unknown protein [Seminavis robusta]|uniref:Uncharacterized protein n=1 Tax=Seminavis robusta TaxID=568900 RepID=A0A9N8HPQ1_9STRA|nr:expressed unknown protein [Seminavis robusta]|eukprot:Sro1198_g251630.1 n/a (409) ;mRNA; r:22290-23516